MPKLPADLPENWTRGQIVSPNGIETGLTEKHGYNYLMKQVNDTQTEVNNINTALPDVAQQATVEEINNKIGTESDADTQPTLFGRLAQLKKVLLEKLAELLTKVTGIDTKIGTSGDTAGTETLFGQVKDISENMPTGSIKSRQEIVIANAATSKMDSTFGSRYYKDYTISPIDKEKSFVVVSCANQVIEPTSDTPNLFPCARLMSNTSVRVYSNINSGKNDSIGKTYIQIIELF